MKISNIKIRITHKITHLFYFISINKIWMPIFWKLKIQHEWSTRSTHMHTYISTVTHKIIHQNVFFFLLIFFLLMYYSFYISKFLGCGSFYLILHSTPNTSFILISKATIKIIIIIFSFCENGSSKHHRI